MDGEGSCGYYLNRLLIHFLVSFCFLGVTLNFVVSFEVGKVQNSVSPVPSKLKHVGFIGVL